MRSGRANAASGRIMVTTPQDHFGPIPPEHDPRGTVCWTTVTQMCRHFICQIAARLSHCARSMQLGRAASLCCMKLAPSAGAIHAVSGCRVCGWESGGRTAWTAGSGAPTCHMSPASLASPASAPSLWCCRAGKKLKGACTLSPSSRLLHGLQQSSGNNCCQHPPAWW